jgi:hypothetical protein
MLSYSSSRITVRRIKKNPVGSENPEIAEQLLSKPQRMLFIDPCRLALCGNQLVDQWGLYVFFHALSGDRCKSAQPVRIDHSGQQMMFLSKIASLELGYFSRQCPFFYAWLAAPFCLSLRCLYLVADCPHSSA